MIKRAEWDPLEFFFLMPTHLKKYTQLFIHFFNKFLLIDYYMSDTMHWQFISNKTNIFAWMEQKYYRKKTN